MTPDANTETASSEVSDDNKQESSTAEQAAEETVAEETTEEVAAETTEGTESAAESTETETPTEEKPEDTVQAVLDKPEDEKLPFHKEPRFQELVGEKNKYKGEVEQLKPLAAQAQALSDFTRQHNIQPQQLEQALTYLRFLNSEPEKALEMLRPTYEKLTQYTGERLPADLQERVAAGTLDAALAKELAQARARQEYQGTRQQMSQQQQAAQSQQANQGVVASWATSKMELDPDFKPKQAGMPDGKWEFVHKELLNQGGVQAFKDPQDALAKTEAAYAEANKFFGQFRKAAAVKKKINSTNSQSNASAVVKTPADVVKAIMSGQRPHQLKYS